MNAGEEEYLDDAFDEQEDAKRASTNSRVGAKRHENVDKEVEQLVMKNSASNRGVGKQSKPQSGYALPGDTEEEENEGLGLEVEVDDEEEEHEEEQEEQQHQ